MKLTFKPLQKEHLPEVLRIEQASFTDAWSEGLFLRELSQPFARYFIGFSENIPVCYGGFWHIVEQADIQTLAVAPAYRRRGAGRALLAFLCEQAAQMGAEAVTLEVRVSNEAAIQLYKNAGFTEAGRRPRYYGDGEDALILFLPLGGTNAPTP